MDLLENIAYRSGCCYLSDLRSEYIHKQSLCRIVDEIGKLPAEKFTAVEWKEACSYMTGKDIGARNGAQTYKDALLDALNAYGQRDRQKGR